MREDTSGQAGSSNSSGSDAQPLRPPNGCDHLHNAFGAGCPWCS
jgi:hypothetical protein